MSDLLDELGALALGSRLKRIADTLAQDSARIYEAAGSGFEPRWFPVFIYLYRRGPTSITELARGLGVSHPGINKIANELIEARLVAPYRDRNDKRKRVLALTRLGRDKQQALEPVWRDVRQSLQSLVDECGSDFLGGLSLMESSLNNLGFYDRFTHLHDRHYDGIAVTTYKPEMAPAFRELNEQWINHHFQMEDADRKVLEDPETTIVNKGGEIFFAIESSTGHVLGTCALVRVSDDRCELSKMAVAEEAKGRQIGLLLGERLVEEARAMGYETVFLESNRKLTPAISLYGKLGFIEKPFPHETPYARADIYMELPLRRSVAA